MKINNVVIILVASVLTISCGPGKAAFTGNLDPSISSKRLIGMHEQMEPKFTTLASRVQVQYDDGDKTQSITVSLRIQKEEAIWVNASILGINIAKILITPDNVSYYETIGKTYFDGDFSLISEWLGADMDFETVQNILLGQAVFDMKDKDYKLTIVGPNYRLTPSKQSDIFRHIFLINPANNKMASQQIAQPQDNRIMTVDYPSYQDVNGETYPKEIRINAIELNKHTKISLDFRNVDINPQVNFAFQIPNGYQEILLD